MNLTAREKKIIFVGVALFVLILFVKLIGVPLVEKEALLVDAIYAKSELLLKYHLTLNKRPRLMLRKSFLGQMIEVLEERLIAGETPTLATAELQSILEKIAKRTKLRLKRIKTLDAEDLGEYSAISVEMTFVSNMRSLLNFLYEVENNEKSLAIVYFDLHFQDSGNGPRLRTVLQVAGGIENRGVAISSMDIPDDRGREAI